MMRTRLQCAALCTLVLFACGDAREEPASNRATPPAPASTPRLTDAHIADIAHASFRALADLSRGIAERTENLQIARYAATVTADHAAAAAELQRLRIGAGLAAADHPAVSGWNAEVASSRARLDSLAGSALDIAYLRADIDHHQDALQRFDTQLIPDATGPGLQTLLQNLRPMIVAHLVRARQLTSAAR